MAIAGITDYKSFLRTLIERRGKVGTQSALAKAIACRPAYLSRVLKGDAHLNLDQVQAASRFFGLTKTEREKWIYLNLENRSNDGELKSFFQTKQSAAEKSDLEISKRIAESEHLETQITDIYYSRWQNAAVHMLLLLPNVETANEVSEHLNISIQMANECLSDLEMLKLIKRVGNGYQVVRNRLHVPADSRNSTRHHLNWRLKAVDRITSEKKNDLRYSSVITCSKNDELKVREEIIQCIQRIRAIVKPSADETVCCYAFDFMNLTE